MKLLGNNKKLTDRLLEGICLCLLFAALLVPYVSEARPTDYINVGNVRNFNLGTWTGAGSLSRTRTACLASANDNNRRPGPGMLVMPYQVMVESNDLPAGNFYIYLNGDSSNTGNKRVQATIHHRDRYDGNSYEQLSYGAYDDTHTHNGDFRGCPTNGNNSQVRVTIDAADMAGKVSGRYQGNFSLTAIGGRSGTATDSDNFRIIVNIQASPEVQISRLDNINLGTHAGVGNINAEENFCVHSTSASGSYTLSVSSANQDGSGNFNLDAAGIGQIPYQLNFIDQANGPGSVAITNNSVSGFGDSTDQFCNGQNNATLSITITEQNLQQAKSGSYADSLIILVAPQ